MTRGGEGSNLKWILGLVAHMSVFAMFAAFLPLGGEMLWWLVVPPVLLLIIGTVVATRADDEPAGREREATTESTDDTGDETGSTTGQTTGNTFEADAGAPSE